MFYPGQKVELWSSDLGTCLTYTVKEDDSQTSLLEEFKVDNLRFIDISELENYKAHKRKKHLLMEDFKTRLEAEKEDLANKLAKLETFLNSDDDPNIDPRQYHLLRIQRYAMETYLEILTQRLILLQEIY